MSIGIFVGPIRNAYAKDAQEVAASFAAAIDNALTQEGLPGYRDPAEAPEVYNGVLFGRSALDHHGAGESCRAGQDGEPGRRGTPPGPTGEEPLPRGLCT